jgi:hypothetical protein
LPNTNENATVAKFQKKIASKHPLIEIPEQAYTVAAMQIAVLSHTDNNALQFQRAPTEKREYIYDSSARSEQWMCHAASVQSR